MNAVLKSTGLGMIVMGGIVIFVGILNSDMDACLVNYSQRGCDMAFVLALGLVLSATMYSWVFFLNALFSLGA